MFIGLNRVFKLICLGLFVVRFCVWEMRFFFEDFLFIIVIFDLWVFWRIERSVVVLWEVMVVVWLWIVVVILIDVLSCEINVLWGNWVIVIVEERLFFVRVGKVFGVCVRVCMVCNFFKVLEMVIGNDCLVLWR